MRKLLYNLRYIHSIFITVKNWPSYFVNYLFFKSRNGIIKLRNGIEIIDREGTGYGTTAVVFIRKHYGDIENQNIIVDIGANIGVFTLFAAEQIKSRGHIYSFEPIPSNFEILQNNINHNNYNEKVTIFNMAVSDRKGTTKMYIVSSPLHSTIVNEIDSKDNQSIVVPTVSIADIIEDNKIEHIDLLKINCEGSEYDIIYSLDNEILSKISEIRMEYHNVDENKNNLDGIIGFLGNYGFRETYRFNNGGTDGFLWMENK
ncbi:MAG: FkbM family methyltransferase [Paludibacter sp.]